ncbi:MAG: glycoside hydrolase family 3 C-terminal domain-containing protein [Clostridia bacterium]|nr:glycoside hydrolase family 3 C-terminal domain-containing protein [Clostridia bacterium]
MDYKFKDTSLPFEERARDLISHLTLEEKINMFTPMQPAVERLGVQKHYFGLEIARGYVGREGGPVSTVFPQPIGLAATFDTDIMKKIGDAASEEARIYYNKIRSGLTLWGPTIDMERDPRWGRTEEAYGEDPCLAGKMVAQYTKGLTGDGKYLKTVPLLKHFYANNNEDFRTSSNSNITPRLKHEYYLKPFETAVTEGTAQGLMTAYNAINGVEGINNKDVRDIVKAKWGAMLAVSDGGDFGQNVADHKTFDVHEDSVAAIFTVGADLMLDGNAMVAPAIKAALEKGLITEKQIDDTLYPPILTRFRIGEFDGELNPYNSIDDSRLCCDEFDKLNLTAALESVILLKNEDMLPLSDKVKSVAVVGPLADVNYQCWYCGTPKNQQITVKQGFENIGNLKVTCDSGFDIVAIKNVKTGKYFSAKQDGSIAATADTVGEYEQFYMEDWDFNACTFKNVATNKYITVTEDESQTVSCDADRAFGWFVKERFNLEKTHKGTVLNTFRLKQLKVDDGNIITDYNSRLVEDKLFDIEIISSGTERIKQLANTADTVVFCGGNHTLINGREGEDRKSLRLPVCQSKMLDAAVSVNSNTVFLMVSSYPYAVLNEIKSVKSVLWCSHIGPHLGTAVASTLLGKNNPAGRTPMTWYESDYELPSIFDYDIMKNNTTYLYYQGKPLFSFGHGLSYSKFKYSNLSVADMGDNIAVGCKVENVSDINGDEVVQVYISHPHSPFKTPIKQLTDFKRISVNAHCEQTVELCISKKDIRIFNTNINDFALLDGKYKIYVGASSEDIRLSGSVVLSGETVSEKQCESTVNPLSADDYQQMEFLTDKDGREYLYQKEGTSFCNFYNLGMHGYDKLFVEYSTPAGECTLTVTDCKTGEVIAKTNLVTTGSLKRFDEVLINISPVNGLRDLKFHFNKTACFKGFRFAK